MQRFPDDTQDSVERLYAPHILKHFPDYGRFWEKFVGQQADSRSGTLRPRGLVYPKSMSKRQQNRLDREYELLCMQNYSVFVHLAGAHFQVGELARALKLRDHSKRHFRHWEAYDVGLLHLSTAISLGKGLVTLVSRLTGQDRAMRRLVQHELWGELDRSVRLPRNDVVHYSRRLHRCNAETGAFEVLRETYFESRKVWSQDLLLAEDDSKWVKAEDKLRKDIVDTETLLNEVWGWLIEELAAHFGRLGVVVRDDGALPSTRPLPVALAVDTAHTASDSRWER